MIIMLLLLLWPSLVVLVALVVLLVLLVLVLLMLSQSVRPSLMLAAFPLPLLVLMLHSFHHPIHRWCWQSVRWWCCSCR